MSAIAGALISGGASLLGGLFGRSSAKKQQRRQNEYNKPINIRKRAEEGGFNPLLWAGQGNIQLQPGPSNIMGNAIAQAGLAAANGLTEQAQLDLEKTKLEQDRERLDKLLQEATIRPKVGGIYAKTENVQSIKKTGAPLLSGGAAASQPSGVIPKENPEMLPEPTTVMRDDGLEGANPDAPPELETDLWDQARQGSIVPFGWEIWKRNTMTDWQRQNWEKTKKAAEKKAENFKEGYKDIFERPRKKDAKLPKIDFPSYLPSISK